MRHVARSFAPHVLFALGSLGCAIGCAMPVATEPPTPADAPDAPPASTAPTSAPAAPTFEGLGCANVTQGGRPAPKARLGGVDAVHDMVARASFTAFVDGAGALHRVAGAVDEQLAPSALRVALGPTGLAWVEPGKLSFLDGSEVLHAVETPSPATAIAVDATHLAWIAQDGGDAVLRRAAIDGEDEGELARGPLAPALASDGAHLWYAVHTTRDGVPASSIVRVEGGGEEVSSVAIEYGDVVKMAAFDGALVVLLRGDFGDVVADLRAEGPARPLWQAPRIDDVAIDLRGVTILEGGVIRRARPDASVTVMYAGGCTPTAIASDGQLVTFAARDAAGSGLWTLPILP